MHPGIFCGHTKLYLMFAFCSTVPFKIGFDVVTSMLVPEGIDPGSEVVQVRLVVSTLLMPMTGKMEST